MAARKIKFDWVAATANDLAGGEAVFRRADGSWTRAVAEAELVPGGEAGAALLARAQAGPAATASSSPC
jgi:hypothetical protein